MDISAYVVITGAVRSDGQGMVICIDSEDSERRVQYAQIARWDGRSWHAVTRLEWQAVSVCVVDDRWFVLGSSGEVLVVSDNSEAQESIGPGLTGLTCLGRVDQSVIAAGMRRQVYQRVGPGLWTALDDQVRRKSPDEGVVGFQALAATPNGELFGCGWKGQVWRLRDAQWTRIETPTNLILTGICASPHGDVYVVGQRGTILRGRDSAWQLIDYEGSHADLWGAGWHNDRLLVSSLSSLYEFAGDRLTRVETELPSATSFYHLSCAGPWIWSIGLRNILARYADDDWQLLR